MKIKIGNLYPYELALYGENGNLKALKYSLEQENVKVEIINIEPNDKLNLKELDMLYIGSGRTKYLDIIKSRLEPYKQEFLDFITKDKVLLATGNGISLLENLDFYEIEYCSNRKVSDVIATTSLCNGVIKGFQNTEYLIKSTNSLLFNMEEGYGNNDTKMEGFQKNNFYATSIIGPILARNDNLCNYFVKILIDNVREKQQ